MNHGIVHAMKLISGVIVAAESLGANGTEVTIQTTTIATDANVTIGEKVQALSVKGFDDTRLRNLLIYLEDRPALMDDAEVKEGVSALKSLCI